MLKSEDCFTALQGVVKKHEEERKEMRCKQNECSNRMCSMWCLLFKMNKLGAGRGFPFKC